MFFKQKTAYEMRISDWSSDVCSSDLIVKVSNQLHQPATFFRSARTRRKYNPPRVQSGNFRRVFLIVPDYPYLQVVLLQIVQQVVGKRIVIIVQDNHDRS